VQGLVSRGTGLGVTIPISKILCGHGPGSLASSRVPNVVGILIAPAPFCVRVPFLPRVVLIKTVLALSHAVSVAPKSTSERERGKEREHRGGKRSAEGWREERGGSGCRKGARNARKCGTSNPF
jgi:hypothetical protein